MGKAKDLTNQRFTKLVALEPTSRRDKAGAVIWKCQCDCGNICEISGTNLRSGHTKSCGCMATEKRSVDLLGQRFGRLIVIENTKKLTSNKRIIWKCKCDCGNICEVSSNDLLRQHTASCGCVNSWGEKKISFILRQNNINFEQQKTFETCRFINTNRQARFDFYIYANINYIIEYDGSQHFDINSQWNNYGALSARDEFKNQWCKDNNIPLIRIPYTHLNNLDINDLKLETTTFRIV